MMISGFPKRIKIASTYAVTGCVFMKIESYNVGDGDE